MNAVWDSNPRTNTLDLKTQPLDQLERCASNIYNDDYLNIF